MSEILLPWRHQPQEALQLSRSLREPPLLAGIGLTDYSREKPTVLNYTGAASYAEGIGFDFNPPSNSQTPATRIAWPDSAITSPTGEITIITSLNLRTPISRANRGVFAKYIGYDSGSVSQRSWATYIDYQTSGSINYPRFAVSGNGSSAVVTPAGASMANGPHTVVATYSPSSRIALFMDGVLYGDNTVSIPSSLFNSSVTASLGTQYSVTDPGVPSQYCISATIGLYALLPYAVTDDEAIEISRSLADAANFLFEPQRIYLPEPPVGPYLPTLSGATYAALTATTVRPRVTVTF